MDKVILAVKDSKGELYTMPSTSGKCILSVHYSTSYLTFELQGEEEDSYGNITYPEKSVYVELDGSNFVDCIAISGEERGTLVALSKTGCGGDANDE